MEKDSGATGASEGGNIVTKRNWQLLWGGVPLAAVAAAILGGSRGDPSGALSAGSAPVLERPQPSAYAIELAELDERIVWLEGRAAAEPPSWLPHADAAGARQERARLTGNYDDYRAADSLFARAFALAPRGAGPHLERAALDFSLHRFDRIERSLVAAEHAVLVNDPTRAAIVGLRADVALQRGRLEEARAGFEAALRLHPSSTAWARLANWHWEAGDLVAAEAALCRSATLQPGAKGSQRAWVHLQLGLMDLGAGKLDAAVAHYRDADSRFSGWWLVEEHIAEVFALQGDTVQAMRMYEDLVRRTGNPEFMDALARLHRTLGEAALSEAWIQSARRIHEQRLALFPEASWGHALRHFLDFGPPEIAVMLAEKNWQLRPNGEARALLEAAYARAGSPRPSP